MHWVVRRHAFTLFAIYFLYFSVLQQRCFPVRFSLRSTKEIIEEGQEKHRHEQSLRLCAQQCFWRGKSLTLSVIHFLFDCSGFWPLLFALWPSTCTAHLILITCFTFNTSFSHSCRIWKYFIQFKSLWYFNNSHELRKTCGLLKNVWFDLHNTSPVKGITLRVRH